MAWPGQLTIVKKDSESKEVLTNAEFEVLDEDFNVIIPTKAVGADGKVVFKKLEPDKVYYVRETKAPAGYDLSNEKIKFTVVSGASVAITLEVMNVKTWYYPGILPEYKPTPEEDTEDALKPDADTEDKSEDKPEDKPTPVPDDKGNKDKTTTPKPMPNPKPSNDRDNRTTDNETPIGGAVDIPKGGTAIVKENPSNGRVTIDGEGNWEYVPNKGYVGNDKFTIIIKKPDGTEEEILIDLDITEVPLGSADLEDEPSAKPSDETAKKLAQTGTRAPAFYYLLGCGALLLAFLVRRKRKC